MHDTYAYTYKWKCTVVSRVYMIFFVKEKKEKDLQLYTVL